MQSSASSTDMTLSRLSPPPGCQACRQDLGAWDVRSFLPHLGEQRIDPSRLMQRHEFPGNEFLCPYHLLSPESPALSISTSSVPATLLFHRLVTSENLVITINALGWGCGAGASIPSWVTDLIHYCGQDKLGNVMVTNSFKTLVALCHQVYFSLGSCHPMRCDSMIRFAWISWHLDLKT